MRELFLLDPSISFLNHGSFGACPREVIEAQQRWQLEMERNPVQFLSRRSAGLLRTAREALAGALGAKAADLVFIPNSTTGVNVVAQSLALRPGDEVLSTDLEYGACDATWARACAARGAHYRRVPIALPLREDEFLDRLLAAVTPRTRLIFCSHITSTTALILPVARLCAAARERGVMTLIDGAHAPGQIELDLDALGADVYVGNCHKWLCAPKGSAFVHARPEAQPALQPGVISWGYVAGTESDPGFARFLGDTPFERHLQWQGTRDLSAWLAVPAALDFQRRHDWPEVRRRCHVLARGALTAVCERHGLEPLGPDSAWAQMVAIPVPAQDAQALQRRLFDEHRIEVPVTTHQGRVFVRLSVQGYNDEGEVKRMLGVVG
jgi:isopenicillin-N epimerase